MDWNVLEHQAEFYIRLVLNNAHFQHQYFVLDPFAAAVARQQLNCNPFLPSNLFLPRNCSSLQFCFSYHIWDSSWLGNLDC